jgi:hypothetical protein
MAEARVVDPKLTGQGYLGCRPRLIDIGGGCDRDRQLARCMPDR